MHSQLQLSAGTALASGLLVVMFAFAGSDHASAGPTCSETLGIAVHGQHVIGDYITGIGRGEIDWPPSGGIVGEAIAGEGASIHGGPGPGFHFQQDPPFAPGASLCLEQPKSPGLHLGP